VSFFREIYFDTKYSIEEVGILFKYPLRKESWIELKRHLSSIYTTIVSHPWYCLKRGIRNLYIWFPIIWKNDCWDYSFMLNMMDKQMKEMEDFFLSDKPHIMKAKQVGKRIRWTRKLMDMWREEYYTMLEYNKHKAKFPNETSMFDHDEEDITRDEYGIPILYKCKQQSKECTNDWRIHLNNGRNMDKKVFSLWLKNLSKIQEWWD